MALTTATLPPASDPQAIVAEAEALAVRLAMLRDEVRRVIFGQDAVIEESLAGILSGGHVLLVGVPGLGKTRLVETLGRALGLDTRRVQFTPDLMPADILGSEVLDEAPGAPGHRAFRFIPGPVFCQLLMADEINRASPRTQSALLQAMQEHHVAVAGPTGRCRNPFMSSRRKIRWSRRAPILCPRRSSIAFCCRSTSPIHHGMPSAPCCWRRPASRRLRRRPVLTAGYSSPRNTHPAHAGGFSRS